MTARQAHSTRLHGAVEGAAWRAVAVACAAVLFLAGCAPRSERAAERARSAAGATKAIQSESNGIPDLTGRALRSLAVITHHGRDGSTDGVGAGFVISSDGLIATSLHVIGEARPVRVRLRDGSRHEVVSIHAFDRKLDLAIVRIEASGLEALPLGDSDELRQGEDILALGNPQGMENSVTRGVLSARRTVEGVEMLQLAVPVEPGNSGGPILDLDGRVQGVMTLKSAVTENLGFAIPAAHLQRLLDAPNPVPMERWLTIGALNTRDWTTHFGGRWTQRAGRIRVEGSGEGFGGRALCLATTEPPTPPYEVTVTVKLDDETGAAGLVFGADGGQRHYGFYPSAGQLRLTRFDGPDVFSWQVLEQVRVPAYRRGDWNTLRVRVERDRILCYVNDALAIEADNPRFAGARAGIAKFRNTQADFKIFQVGETVGPERIPEELMRGLQQAVSAAPGRNDAALLSRLGETPGASRAVLLNRARGLEAEAKRLRRLADSVHHGEIARQINAVLESETPSLAHAALLVARLDNEDLDVAAYLHQLDAMAAELKSRLPANADAAARLRALREFLFVENGFHGSRTDYYNASNSYLNEVMDDREGLPITLAILFVELGRAIGLTDLDPTLTPGHMLVRHAPADEPLIIVDPFDGGKLLSNEEAAELVEATNGARFRGEHLRRSGPLETITRLLANLMSAAEKSDVPGNGLHYLDLILLLNPDATLERLQRGMLRLRAGDVAGAREDLSELLEAQPPGLDLERIAELLRSL